MSTTILNTTQLELLFARARDRCRKEWRGDDAGTFDILAQETRKLSEEIEAYYRTQEHDTVRTTIQQTEPPRTPNGVEGTEY